MPYVCYTNFCNYFCHRVKYFFTLCFCPSMLLQTSMLLYTSMLIATPYIYNISVIVRLRPRSDRIGLLSLFTVQSGTADSVEVYCTTLLTTRCPADQLGALIWLSECQSGTVGINTLLARDRQTDSRQAVIIRPDLPNAAPNVP